LLPEPNIHQFIEDPLRLPALLALEDGSLFRGESIGVSGQTTGEVVFNTAMTGYQEILTDPSYYQQIVTLTYPHIGNVGTNPDDEESPQVYSRGLIVRDLPERGSNWRNTEDLSAYLVRNKVVAIAGIDTRRLTRILRDKGALSGCIVAGEVNQEAAVEAAKGFTGLKGKDLAKEVTTPRSYTWHEGTLNLDIGCGVTPYRVGNKQTNFRVIAYDFGIKRNILRILTDYGCHLTVLPAQTPAEEVFAMNPDGVFLSNGPGDPEPCRYAIKATTQIIDFGIPTFGICLGHQLLALASGARTVKMKFGHHGANHPVQDLATGRVLISSQNHGFAVDELSLPGCLRPTHRSLFDGSLQGIHREDRPAFGFQGHPEASPGPQDLAPLFDHFIELMEMGPYVAGEN
jgi:carbamoyl-phosphate synthase small subunit